MWTILTTVSYVMGLMPGCEDNNLVGSNYNNLARQPFLVLIMAGAARIIYSQELDLFWEATHRSVHNLPSMCFGLDSATGCVTLGTDADEITLESAFSQCDKAPYGARKAVNMYFNKT